MQKYKIPTGFLFTDNYSHGQLETLSIGDYGKERNIKADFLGFTKELNGVENGEIKSLSEKWVITLSTQYGCIQNCTFCDCPKVKFKGNASFNDLKQQFYSAVKCFPDVKYTDRLNLHYARMGEPLFNIAVFDFTEWLWNNKKVLMNELGLRIETIHPVLTTSLPTRLSQLEERLLRWIDIKNNLYNGQAGLQISVNSTSNSQRDVMFSGNAMRLEDFAQLAEKFPDPIGRKYTLNFALASDYIVDAKLLASMFDSEKWMCKITPIHNNNACKANNIETIGGYESYLPYKQVEEDLKKNGFDTLVFVPSMDEEDGLVTCGNALLSGSEIKVKSEDVNNQSLITGINFFDDLISGGFSSSALAQYFS